MIIIEYTISTITIHSIFTKIKITIIIKYIFFIIYKIIIKKKRNVNDIH